MEKTVKTSSFLHQAMTDYLETMISGGVLKPGERLIPLRELGSRFGVSPSTARRGVERLCRKGLLEMRHGSGVYVVERRSVPENYERAISVFVISDDLSDSYCAHALRGVQLEAARRGWPLRLYFPTYEEAGTPGFIERHASAWNSDAVIMLGCYDGLLRKVPRRCPGVGMEMCSSYGGVFSVLSLDPFSAAEAAAEYFLERGVSRVKVLSHELPIFRMRAGAFLEQWRRHGTAETVEFAFVGPECYRREPLRDDSCGYYVTSGSIFQDLAVAYRKDTGGMLGFERCVLSVDGKSLLLPGYEPVDTIALDWQDAGTLVMEEALRRIGQPGSPARRIFLNGTLKTAERPHRRTSRTLPASRPLRERALK